MNHNILLQFIPLTTKFIVRRACPTLFFAQHMYFPASDFSSFRIFKNRNRTRYFLDFFIWMPFLVHQYVMLEAFACLTRHINLISVPTVPVTFVWERTKRIRAAGPKRKRKSSFPTVHVEQSDGFV